MAVSTTDKTSNGEAIVRYNDVISLANGACFHNVDLHIHSYGASQDVIDTDFTPVAIVEAAVA